MRHLLMAGLLAGAFLHSSIVRGEAVSTAELAVPVFDGDLEQPYKVIGPVKDNLRKPFPTSSDPSREKIYAELWERGKKMGADAVINARYGPTKQTLLNFGKTPISGTAIKFIDAGKTAAPAPK